MAELGVAPGIIPAEAQIEIDGQDQPALASGLLSALVLETTEGLYRCEAHFGNWGAHDGQTDYMYFDRRVLDFGKPIALVVGADEGRGEIFRGRISSMEGQFRQEQPPAIVVLAEDRAMDLRMVRRTRAFEDMSDADVFNRIAGEHGLRAAIDISGPTHKVIAQVNQSDLAFVRERARRVDAEVWLEDRTLHVQPRTRRSAGGELVLEFGHGLLEFIVAADLAHQHTSLVVSGWDVQAKERISYEAGDAALGSELDGGKSGASVLSSSFGQRVDRIVQQVPLTSAEAQAIAEASFRAQARRFVCGTGLARGDARLRVGARVTLRGLGLLCRRGAPPLWAAGGWWLHHRVYRRAGRTGEHMMQAVLSLLDSFAPLHAQTGHGGRLYGVYAALVTDGQDPEGLGRVRLRLPWTTDPNGDSYEVWARIATLMAGSGRGTWFIPEPNDEVLVAFEAGDPHRPYVIGGLWNGVDNPPEQMRANNPIRSITSRSGIVITFDDTDSGVTLTLETPGGQQIVCADTPPSIQISDESGNSVKMETSGVTITTPAKLSISASTIEVSAGMVTVNAGMSRFSGVVQSDTNITNSTISA